MCDPTGGFLTAMAIGAATGGIGAAVTGGDIGQGMLMGGIMGGITGGFMPPGVDGIASSGFLSNVGMLGAGTTGATTAISTAIGMSTAQMAGMAITGLAGSVAMGLIAPQQEYTAEAWDYSPIAYNSQENQVTGSGGNQAAAVLSDEIKRAKSKRAKQAQPKQDSYVNTESFANTGLQLA